MEVSEAKRQGELEQENTTLKCGYDFNQLRDEGKSVGSRGLTT